MPKGRKVPREVIAKLTEKRLIADATFLIVFDAPRIAESARPGQFAMVGFPSPSSDPFLRRPLAIAGAEWGRIEFIVRVVGWGTALLANLNDGDEIPILGPLGNGFPEPKKEPILVAGGIGIAPLFFAARRWKNVSLLYGEKTGSSVCDLPMQDGYKITVSTDDGSYGEHGLVTELLAERLDKASHDVYCCGPTAMIRAAANICAAKKAECYVSLEERMACGIGVCQGCVFPTKDGYKRVCKDGPVFRADEIEWEATDD